MATSRAITKRDSASSLMPPPPPPKRQKRPTKVLDENVYSEAVTHIIARDFFPGLRESEAQKEYVDALDSDDREWIREAGRKLTQIMTPGPERRRSMGRGTGFTPNRRLNTHDTPKTQRNFVGETPSRTPLDRDHFAPEEDKPDVNMSLGAFQARYTSEDNESFNALLDKQNGKRAAHYAFFHYGNKIPTSRQIAYRERHQELLEASGKTSEALVTKNAAGEERILLSHARPSQDLDARPASVDSFPERQGPRNHFMFGPEGVEDRLVSRAQLAEERSNAPPKGVNYGGTRFSEVTAESEIPVPPSPSMSAIDAAIAGRPKATQSEVGYSGAETPRINGYAFVDAEPTPSELALPVTEEEEREAAKSLLPKVDDTGPNPFNIKERSKREDLHHKLVEKADAGRRKGGRMDQLRSLGITPGRTQTPKFPSGANTKSGKGSGMTPAARALANRIGTPRREADLFGSSKPECGTWTPTPQNQR